MRKAVAVLWQHEFCWRLPRATGTSICRSDLRRTIRRLPVFAMPGTDAAVETNRLIAQSLHAAQVLLEDHGLSRAETTASLTTAFTSCGAWLVRTDVRLWLLIDKYPFLIVSAQGPAKLVRTCHGNGLEVIEERDATSVTVRVERCPFQEYFWNASRPELTEVMRAWDANWIEVINRSKRPMAIADLSDKSGQDPRYILQFRNLAKRPAPKYLPLRP